MISKSKNFLFIHVPKTGGNSIQNILSEFADDKIVTLYDFQDGVERFELRNSQLKITKHSCLSDYKSQLSKDYYKQLFKFSVIRNPFERLISYYFSPHRNVKAWNRADFIEVIKEVNPLENYIKTKESFVKKILGKQPLDDEIDYLIRFENLEADFKEVCGLLNIPFNGLPHRNRSNRGSYVKYYDEELILLIQNKFRAEIVYGDYTL